MKQYLDIVKKVLSEGRWKQNRTGIDTIAIPGCIFEHDMSEGFPLLTTKHVPFGLVASELEFFIKGLTDKKWLQDRNNHIWDEWCSPSIIKDDGTPETRAKMKLERDLGPIYGWQWRHFGADYSKPIRMTPEGKSITGVDQLWNLVEKLKTNPNDRRMIVSAWNPTQLHEMALPACHYGFQVTHIDGVLSLEWNQRSVDTLIGLPFNIASYGLLLELLCLETGFKPGKLIGFLADTHIYKNHIEGAEEQLKREPKSLPSLAHRHQEHEEDSFSPDPFEFFKWEYSHCWMENYDPHPKIKFEVAV
jgi:thymidylate synthase